MQIKFLFINAINHSEEIETRYPPLGIGYLAVSLRKHFGEEAIEFKVIDRNVEEEIVNFKPEIIGISSVSQNYNKAIEYAKIAKKYDLPVICGGVHISMMPSSLAKDMDVGVIGEGEATICELFELYKRKSIFVKDDLQKIKGIIYRGDNGKIVITDKRELIEPLDNIPLPARDLLGIKEDTYMFTSRGCPYACTFCASSRFWNNIRFFSAEYVINEIMFLFKEYNVKHISFCDDLFSADINRMKEMINLLKEKNILRKISFSGTIRANLVNDETMGVLKELGLNSVGIGLESGCDETLKYLKRQSLDVKDNENAVKIIKKSGISLHCSFIIGSPKEKKENILETLRFIKENRLQYFDVYLLTPFPGTPVWDYAMSKGLVSEKMDWDKLNVNFDKVYDRAVILSENLTRNEMYELYLKFMRYRRRVSVCSLIKKGLQNPLKIPGFLIKRLNKYLARTGRLGYAD